MSTLQLSPLDDVLNTATFVAPGMGLPVALVDVSLRPRYGCKGPGAATWLQSMGLPVPALPNSAVALAGDGHVLRLGMTEFLVEAPAQTVQTLSCTPRSAGVYPVLRQDLCLHMTGRRLPQLLLQTCSFNFAALDLTQAPVVLTSMVGVAVTILPGERNGVPDYRIWCDGSFGIYLWHTLSSIAVELGGGPVRASFE